MLVGSGRGVICSAVQSAASLVVLVPVLVPVFSCDQKLSLVAPLTWIWQCFAAAASPDEPVGLVLDSEER